MTKKAFENILGALNGKSELLMKRKILALGKSYMVMDKDESPLCYVRLDMGSNLAGNLLSGSLGKWAGRSLNYTYTVQDSNEEVALHLQKGPGAWKTNFAVLEETGENHGVLSINRGLMGGMVAQWVDPGTDQVSMVTQGNILKRQYAILNQDEQEIGSVRHKIAAIRDTWNLNLNSGGNILNAVILATVLDFEKEM